jgi:hypothetical protein
MSVFRIGFTRVALVACLAVPAAAWPQIDVGISITIPPPPLPVYEQPPIPDEGYIWSPGYWAYDSGDYYWVPGTWVRPPAVGLLWTPGYWFWNGNVYVFNRGYWGPHVGFYGGVNYGYGYIGNGYQGGYWNRGAFVYNRAINNFGNRRITHVYSKPVINNVTINYISYNGGRGGINARPDSRQQSYARERHVAPTPVQIQHVQAAIGNREQRASFNNGRPPVAATNRPAQFNGTGVVAARAAGGPLPERLRQDRSQRPQDDHAGSRPNRPGSPNELRSDPARDNTQQQRLQSDRAQVPVRSQPEQQQNVQQLQQREQQQRSQQGQQREQQQREQQMQQQREQQNVQQLQQREQQQRGQQVQQQREQQQRDQQLQQREQQQREQQQQRSQQVQQREQQQVQQQQRAQQVQQQREQQQARQAQQVHEQQRPPQAQPQREQRPPQVQQREQQQRAEPREERKPQGDPRRDDKPRE